MINKDNPAKYFEDLSTYCLAALRRHTTSPCEGYACDDCPYGPENHLHDPCQRVFLHLLPDVLRSYPDDRSQQLADNMDRCLDYGYDTCAGCEFFDRCFDEEDFDPILEAAFNHLRSIGAYQAKKEG